MSVFLKLVLHWPRFGPYHLARAEAAARYFRAKRSEVVGLEIAGRDNTYLWREEIATKTSFHREILFPKGVYEELDDTELRQAIFRALDEMDPDAVAVCGYSAVDARACLHWCRSRRRRAILMTETTLHDKRRLFFLEMAKQVLLRSFSTALCGGSLHRDYLIKLGMPPERIFDKYDVVDNEYFARAAERFRDHPDQAASLPGLKSRRPFLLASNRFLPRKNLHTLLDAYRLYRAQAPDGWGLVLLGSGAEEERLRQKVAQENIPDVTFPGFRQVDELPAYYARAGCFVHPALIEPWGLVINEAMASALPVIVSRGVGCAPDLVRQGENGFVFDPANSAELATCISRVASDPQLRNRMAENSKAIIANWTVDHFGENLWRAFTKAECNYRVAKYRERTVFAYPDESGARKRRYIECFSGFTVKRRIVKNCIRLAMRTGTDRLVFDKCDLKDRETLLNGMQPALDEIATRLGSSRTRYALLWPAERNRSRVYAYAFHAEAEPVAFIKLSYADHALLQNEQRTLELLQEYDQTRFKVPRIRATGLCQGTGYLVTECVPIRLFSLKTKFPPAFAQDCLRNYAGKVSTVSPATLQQLSWLRGFWAQADPDSSFAQCLRRDQETEAQCCRVHGDLTVANLIPRGNGGAWIIDWELSHEAGPVMTDVVTFYLGNRQYRLTTHPEDVLAEFRREFYAEATEAEQRAVRLALAFLCGSGSGLGKNLVRAWNAQPD